MKKNMKFKIKSKTDKAVAQMKNRIKAIKKIDLASEILLKERKEIF